MPRAPRSLVDHGCYHLIARGNNRHYVFDVPDGHQRFLQQLLRAKQQYPLRLFHYCLMTNHLHLLVQVARGGDLPRFMQKLLQGYGRWHKAPSGYLGHLWQGRYKSPQVAEESYFLEAGRYIERNPLRARMVTDLAAYPWSSYGYYAQGRRDPLVDEDPYYAPIGATPAARQAAYRAFVQLEPPHEALLDRQLLDTAF